MALAYCGPMQICYIDEAGGCEDPDSSTSATPVMIILGLVIDAAQVPAITRDFLALKRAYFPGRFTAGHALDHILTEIKGSEILQMTRSDSRNKRRQAQRIRSEVISLVKSYDCKVVGRIWIKESHKTMDPTASYCYAVQDVARHFNQILATSGDTGIIIADSRNHHTNRVVAHSIFTQKSRTGGDAYPSIREIPLFAASDNHAGLQIADLLASTLIFPMATAAYCPTRPKNSHSSKRYKEVGEQSGSEIKELQYRYRDETGRWRGGLVVSDPIGHKPGSQLFKAK